MQFDAAFCSNIVVKNSGVKGQLLNCIKRLAMTKIQWSEALVVFHNYFTKLNAFSFPLGWQLALWKAWWITLFLKSKLASCMCVYIIYNDDSTKLGLLYSVISFFCTWAFLEAKRRYAASSTCIYNGWECYSSTYLFNSQTVKLVALYAWQMWNSNCVMTSFHRSFI